LDSIIQITVTGNSRETMKKIGRRLVEKRLASCAQISGPIKSFYWWRDKLEETEEWVCILKSRSDLYEKIQMLIRKMHPYEVPEITATELSRALPEYERWIRDETRKR